MDTTRWKSLDIIHNHLIMWGGADQCRVNYPILKQLGYEILAIIDDTTGKTSPFPEVPILRGEQGLTSFLKEYGESPLGFVVAIGNPYGHVRMKLDQNLRHKGLVPISFADPTALICRSVQFGDGLQVMPGVILHNEVVIGRECIVNTKALVEHDCVLDDGVEVGPAAVLCGRVHVGENTWVGANATVRPRIKIGRNSIIGAGSVVVKDIPDNVVVAGAPAEVIRKNLINE